MILIDYLHWYPYRGSSREFCHMIGTESLDELHKFAGSIGLKRCWFHKHHYDLTPGKRFQAMRAGAKEADSKELVEQMAVAIMAAKAINKARGINGKTA